MTNIIDRAAKTMRSVGFEDSSVPWDRISPEAQSSYREYVRVVLESLRIPSDEMIEAGRAVADNGPAAVWSAMLAAALR